MFNQLFRLNMNIYAANIIDHYKNPRNKEKIKESDASHQEFNHSCGDDILVLIKIEDDILLDIKFDGSGCAVSQAGISILSEKLVGGKIDDILQYDFKFMQKILGVPISERRYKCAMIGLLAIQKAIIKKQKQTP